MKFRGWKGQLGRKLPDLFWELILTCSTRRKSHEQRAIGQIRATNVDASRALARALSIAYLDDPLRGVSTVSKSGWRELSTALQEAGFKLGRVSLDAASYRALSVWSVHGETSSSKGATATHSGLGAIWAVYSDGKSLMPDIQDFTQPIDAVYTWVDAADPQWQESYLEFKESIPAGASHPSSRDLARYTSRDELKYSLRSLEMNMPWIRTVYLVTAGQAPSWLDTSNTKIKLVSHAEIFDSPEECLPTFNSHAIETQLSNIVGLSEHFIYINDDIFFGRPMSPNIFFTGSGAVKYSLANGHYAEAENPRLAVNLAARLNADLLQSRYGKTTALKFQHVAHPQRKSIHEVIRKAFADKVNETARHKFRHVDDISVSSSLAHYVAAAEGMGVPVQVDYAYVDLGGDHLPMRLMRLMRGRGNHMFCLNEVASVSGEEKRGLLAKCVLDALFPYKSSFEK